jgi:hypothetical protein
MGWMEWQMFGVDDPFATMFPVLLGLGIVLVFVVFSMTRKNEGKRQLEWEFGISGDVVLSRSWSGRRPPSLSSGDARSQAHFYAGDGAGEGGD